MTGTSRYIFSINPGRSGSAYLAALLGTCPGVRAEHEAKPVMAGDVLRRVRTLGLEATRDERRIKPQAVRSLLERSRRAQVYAETNHMFIKTFFDVVVDELGAERTTVVVLRRDPVRTVKSFADLGYFTPFNDTWPDWMETDAYRRLGLERVGGEPDQIDLILAYLVDIERRAVAFRDRYPEAATLELHLEELQSPVGVQLALTELGLHPGRRTMRRVGRRHNRKLRRKRSVGATVPLERCAERLRSFLRSAAAADVPLPPYVTDVWPASLAAAERAPHGS